MAHIEGMIQEVQYKPETGQTSRLYHRVKSGAVDFASDAVPTIEINSPGGTELVAATNMSWPEVSSGIGFLNYDAVAVALTVGLVVTGGTSGHEGMIDSINAISATEGVIKLTGITGAFQNNETLTDTGSGSVTVAGTAHSSIAYYDLDASSTDNYPASESFRADVVFAHATVADRRSFFFDCVMYPFNETLVSSEEIDERHPDWIRRKPKSATDSSKTVDWSTAIEAAHAEIARRIRGKGKRAHAIIKSEELYPYEFAFAEAEIAMRTAKFTESETTKIKKAAQALWDSMGVIYYENDNTEEADSGGPLVMSGTRLTR